MACTEPYRILQFMRAVIFKASPGFLCLYAGAGLAVRDSVDILYLDLDLSHWSLCLMLVAALRLLASSVFCRDWICRYVAKSKKDEAPRWGGQKGGPGAIYGAGRRANSMLASLRVPVVPPVALLMMMKSCDRRTMRVAGYARIM